MLLQFAGRAVLIDTTPDFRQQALRARMDRLDAILLTHEHADHIMGLDDVRPFGFHRRDPIPVYGSEQTIEAVERCFRYAFDGAATESSRPKLSTARLNGESFDLFGLSFQPVPLRHGRGASLGFRFGNAAYLTDHSEIPPESLDMLHGLDVLFLDALRHKPHPTHSTVERSRRYVEQLAPRRAFFTHICHDLAHARTEELLPANIRLAYDGLEIDVEGAD